MAGNRPVAVEHFRKVIKHGEEPLVHHELLNIKKNPYQEKDRFSVQAKETHYVCSV